VLHLFSRLMSDRDCYTVFGLQAGAVLCGPGSEGGPGYQCDPVRAAVRQQDEGRPEFGRILWVSAPEPGEPS
jgi:hypothetical protein